MKNLNIYVAPGANPGATGTKEDPFSTLSAAKKKAKELQNEFGCDITVYLRGGEYRYQTPEIFTAEDSAMDGTKITYQAYPGEQPFLGGAIRISGWEKESEEEAYTIWKAKVPEGVYSRHLYIDGQRAARTKTGIQKNRAWETVRSDTFQRYRKTGSHFNGEKQCDLYEGYLTQDPMFLTCRNPQDIEFVYDVGWTHSVCPVESVTETKEGIFLKMKQPCFKDCQIKIGMQIDGPSYVENLYELLGTDGGWYLDRQESVLYVAQPKGISIEEQTVELPVAEQLLVVRGEKDRPVKNLVFRGLTFRYTTFLNPGVNGHPDVQANILKDPDDDALTYSYFKKTQSCVVLDHAEGIIFDGCRFLHLGNGAVDIQHGSADNRLMYCELSDISGNGIQAGDFQETDAHPADSREIVRDNSVENCYIHNAGAEFKGSVGILCGYAKGLRIIHNELCDLPYSAVSLGWGWGYVDPDSDTRYSYKPLPHFKRYMEESVCREHEVRGNYIHHVLTQLHDGAGIYTLGLMPGTKIMQNLIVGNYQGSSYPEEVMVHNSWKGNQDEAYTRQKGFPGGIYMDEASGGMEVRENIIYQTVVPIHYHNIMEEKRFRSNIIRDNTINKKPCDHVFPHEIAAGTGITAG